jgi:hypothetical protein
VIAVGIDPGVNTGVAIWSAKMFSLQSVETMTIIQAMERVLGAWRSAQTQSIELIVIVEDARRRTRFDKADKEEEGYREGSRREGVGSVKRDSKIWEEFLTHHGIPFEMRMPRGTKMEPDAFSRLTGWKERTSKHARDAAMVVFQLNSPILRLKLQTYLEQRERPSHDGALPSGARLRTRRRSSTRRSTRPTS